MPRNRRLPLPVTLTLPAQLPTQAAINAMLMTLDA